METIIEKADALHCIPKNFEMIRRIGSGKAIWRIKMMDDSTMSVVRSCTDKDKESGRPITVEEKRIATAYIKDRASKLRKDITSWKE